MHADERALRACARMTPRCARSEASNASCLKEACLAETAMHVHEVVQREPACAVLGGYDGNGMRMERCRCYTRVLAMLLSVGFALCGGLCRMLGFGV